jgi:hypothetical protein
MSWTKPSTALARIAAISVLASLPVRAADVTLRGRVVDENDAPVFGARVTVRRAADSVSVPPRETQTDPDGAFEFTFLEPADILITVEREGYYALKDRSVHIEAAQELTLVINTVREVFQSQDVNEQTSPVDVDQTQNQQTLTGTEVNDIPYANSHSLRNALPLMPGVVEEASGALHVNGASENQVLYVLNGFDISNPISGQFQTVLAVEGIRSLNLATGSFSPEFGRGSAGVLNISTENGTDTFHYTATDFIPGFNIQHGARLGNWYPRVGVSGPIVRKKAWFSDTFDSQYTETLVNGLPNGQNTTTGWAGSNLLHAQVNLTPSNILLADFLVNIDHQDRVGLGPLSPAATTTTLRTREYMGSIRDQVYFGHGLLVEFGYAHNDYSDVQTPQGQNLYLISPQGNSGNYFLNANQTASRDQGLVHAWLPQFQLAGTHRIEVGTDADFLHYSAAFDRTGYEVLGLTGQPLSETLFPNPAAFSLGDSEVASWLLDTWRVSKRLQFALGIREDWDRRFDTVAWSPRAGFSWSPFASGRTRVSGGYSLTHDAVTLGMLGQPYDQTAITIQFNPDGAPAGTPVTNTFTIGNAPLVLPRATSWNLGVDRQITPHLFVAARALRRRGSDGFAFIDTLAPNAPPSLLPLPGSDLGGVYQLENLRRDDYDSAEISIRQTFSGQYEWMADYTRSRALSNAVLDPDTAQPLQVLEDMVPVPWSTPNRLLVRAYLPLPRKNWAVSAMADMRSGFPFSVRGESGVIAGVVDSYRYPLNFDLNLAIERMVTFHGQRFAFRGGVDNLANQANPTGVYNVIGAPQFLQFVGDEGRHYVVRIRFFGRANKI